MEAASTSETLVKSNQTIWHYDPEDSYLHTHHCENLKSYKVTIHSATQEIPTFYET
jgi:hypothetical protein